MLPREIDHLIDLGRGDLAHIRSAHPHPLAMHLQHHLRGLFPAHRENSLQHDNDKVHRCVIVVQQQHLVQRRRLGSDFLDLEKAAVLLLVAIVAAIALTMRRRKDTKYVDPAKQVMVKREDRVRLVSMPTEKQDAPSTNKI